MTTRKPYPSDVSDEEWAFVAPYLTLVREDAPQRNHDLREVFNSLRWVVRTGSPWRYMPHDLPPWEAVYQQTQRWLKAGVFEEMVHDLRVLLRLSEGRASDPIATIIDSRETTHHFGRVAFRCVRLPLFPAGSRHSQRGFITCSKEIFRLFSESGHRTTSQQS